MGYKVNPPSTDALRQMAVQRLGAPIAPDGVGLTGDEARKLLEELAVSKIEGEIQNAYLQETCARLDVALNDISDLYDFAPICCFSTDVDGKITKLNLAGASLLGMERSTLLGRVFMDYFASEQRDRIQALMRQATLGGEDQRCDVSLLVGNRAPKHLELAVSPLSSMQGHHLVLTDITERKLLENKLRRSEERWKFALDATGDGVWEWDVVSDTLRYSPRLAQHYSAAPTPYDATMDGWRERVHPDDWAGLLIGIQKCLTGQEARFTSEHRHLSREGQWKWVRCQGAVFGRDAQGKATRLIGSYTDISEYKGVQEELHEVHSIQQAVFELLPQYLAVVNAEGRVVQTNAVWNAHALASGHAYRKGYVHSDFADLLDAVTGGDGPIKQEALGGIGDVLAGKVPTFKMEYAFESTGEQRWFIMLVMAADGAQARAVVSHQDITRLKRGSVGRAAH